uniref:ARAD1D02662p n=1 Tax=Blastobotrys adeninivorans TaxID=409370 RepID=A0A060T8C9_BLAAD
MPQKIQSRRSHKKSRLGCLNCKRRRIKCDESRPQCTNCIRHSITCDYLQVSQAGSSATSLSVSPESEFDNGSVSRVNSPAWNGEDSVQSPSLALDSASSRFDYLDLDLYQHYIAFTSSLMDTDEQSVHRWRFDMPAMASFFPFIYHLMLALSGLHKAQMTKQNVALLRERAHQHYNTGVRGLSALLPTANDDNCEAIYIGSTLVCLCYFAAGPKPGEYVAFSSSGGSEFFKLFRGVRLIIESHSDVLHKGVLASKKKVGEDFKTAEEIRQEKSEINDQYDLVELKNLISGRIGKDTDLGVVLLGVITALEATVYQLVDAPPGGGLATSSIMGWLYRLPAVFTERLQQKCPLCLVVFAHYIALFESEKALWLLRGWGRHVIGAIYDYLPDYDRQYISLPMRIVGYE